MVNSRKIAHLLEIMERLRDKESGCPWDKEQTFSTIVPHTIEEAYEVADAIERNTMDELQEELGDLLFQIVFYAQIAKEKNIFNFDDVVNSIIVKLVNRHPHVFGNMEINSPEEQNKLWEDIKKQERQAYLGKNRDKTKTGMDVDTQSTLENIPKTLPALTRAYKLHKKASMVGFDWSNIEGVMGKLNEEIGEVRYEIKNGQLPERMQDEIGDILFVTTILARHAGVDPEAALRHANNKFERRFRGVEALLVENNIDINEASLEKMDAMWDIVKTREKQQG